MVSKVQSNIRNLCMTIVITIAVSVILVNVFDAIFYAAVQAAAQVYARAVPPKIRAPLVEAVDGIGTPLVVFGGFVVMQQIANMFIATPFVMSAIDDLKKAKGNTKQDQDDIDAAIKRATICRQTIVRSTLFILTAAVVTTFKMKAGMRRTIDGLRHII
jgi:hypothetical protein